MMSGSVLVSTRDQDALCRGDRSVGSCRSSSSGARKSKHFMIEKSPEEGALYLPSILTRRHRASSLDGLDCDRSLQELDDTVASVSKHYSPDCSLDGGERSPTSVSYEIGGSSSTYSKETEQVLRHLARPTLLDFGARVESTSGRSTASSRSKKSKNSRAPKGSREARKKRIEKLEKKICQTILSSASETSDSSYSTKECNDSACRSAQFILTDLFYEASKSMDESALPQPPFRDGTSWSHIPHNDQARAKSSELPPRHPECQPNEGEGFSAKDSNHSKISAGSTKDPSQDRMVPKEDPPTEDPVIDIVSASETRKLADVLDQAETASDSSSVYVFPVDFHEEEPTAFEEQNTTFTMRGDNTTASDCTGTLGFSMDDSLLQYSSTNGTTEFSPLDIGLVPDNSPTQLSAQQRVEEVEQTQEEPENSAETCWTSFDGSPFQEAGPKDENGFGAFSPFDEGGEGNEQWPAVQQKSDPPAAFDSAWDTSRVLPITAPTSPASVFNFFCEGDDQDDAAFEGDSKNDVAWNISDIGVHELNLEVAF